MKNRNYTLIVPNVPEKLQGMIFTLLSSLQEYISALGLTGAALTNEPSPEPVPEVWIVEVEYAGWTTSTTWLRSRNRSTCMDFSTQADAEAAILKNTLVGDATDLAYRARRVSPAEEWIVEYRSSYADKWNRSCNDGTTAIFNTQTEAQKAADMQTDGYAYRVRLIN